MNSSVTPAETNILRSPPRGKRILNRSLSKKESICLSDKYRGPVGFVRRLWDLSKFPEHERKISNFQLASAITPVLMGIIGIPALLASNYLRDPSQNPDSQWQKILTWMGKSFQIVFEILTLNNVLLAITMATPSRFLTYSSLAIANAYYAQFEWKQIDLCNAIRDKNKEIQEIKKQIATTNEHDNERLHLESDLKKLIEEKRELYNKLDNAESQSNFFARVLMNVIMAFSFAYFPSHISPSAKFGNLHHAFRSKELTSEMAKDEALYTNGYGWKRFTEDMDFHNIHSDAEKVGPYKACHPNGYTWEDLWNGVPNGATPAQRTPSLPKLMLLNAQREWNSFVGGLKNTFEAIANPKEHAQGTLWGHNQEVEKKLGYCPEGQEPDPNAVKDTFLNRWRVRLSGGLMPITLNNLNIVVRFAIAGMAGGAVSLIGMSAYNKEKPIDEDFEEDIQGDDSSDDTTEPTLKESVGEFCLDGSKSMIWWGRMLSGVSGLLNSFNPNFLNGSGLAAVALNGVASGFSIGSAVVGGIPGLATVDIFAQFLSTILYNGASGLGALHRQLEKDHIVELLHRGPKQGLEMVRGR